MRCLALFAALALAFAPAALGQTAPPQRKPPIVAPNTVPRPSVAPMGMYAYTARTAGMVRRTGAVTGGGITWQCTQNYCMVSGPWRTPGVGSCHALALEVGAIVSYGHPAAQLNAAQLAQCNAGVAASSSTTTIAPPAPAGVAVTTPELSAVGGATVSGPPDVAPIAITTPELSAVGGAAPKPTSDIPPVHVTTPEISTVGR